MANHGFARSDESPVDSRNSALAAPPRQPPSATPTVLPAPPRLIFNARLQEEAVRPAGPNANSLPGLVGNSVVMQRLYAAALGLADAGHPILISGRAGSGKSALARALHRASKRRGDDLRIIRSITFPDYLSVADGTVPGREARFARIVTTGTVVLDEIADLSFAAQTTLMQWLMCIEGPINVIALTHTPIEHAVAEGRFRSDLLHFLSTRHLVLPDLDERVDDLRPLAEHFRETLSATNRQVVGFSDDAWGAMHRHPWPGNVRELQNRIERAMLIACDTLIHAEDLGLPIPHE